MGKLFEIDDDSIVKGTGEGYYYCTTTPPHPYGESRKDRKKKYVYLHRAILEQKLGRFLEPGEQADHKDKDKSNNSPSNIVLVEIGPHQKDHARNRGNHFWEKSPMNKPKSKKASSLMDAAIRVAADFISSIESWTI